MGFQRTSPRRLHQDFIKELSWLDIPLANAGFTKTSMVQKSKIIANIFSEVKHHIDFSPYKIRNKKRGVNVKILL